jgi:hypothetical protein
MDAVTWNQFATFGANYMTINEWSYWVILATLYCIFVFFILASGHIKIKRGKVKW